MIRGGEAVSPSITHVSPTHALWDGIPVLKVIQSKGRPYDLAGAGYCVSLLHDRAAEGTELHSPSSNACAIIDSAAKALMTQ